MAQESSDKGIGIPLVMAIAATRALGGIGVGLLLAGRMDADTRRSVGTALLTAGIASSAPLVLAVMARTCCRHACEPAS